MSHEQMSIYVQEGEDAGRILDPNIAHEIALLDKDTRDYEALLEKQASGEMTELEKRNIEIIFGLKEKYPDALKVDSTKDGNIFAAVDVVTSKNGKSCNGYILTTNGLFRIGISENSQGHISSKLDMSKCANLLVQGDVNSFLYEVPSYPIGFLKDDRDKADLIFYDEQVSFQRVDVRCPSEMRSFKNHLISVQNEKEKLKAKEERRTGIQPSSEILDQL